jgi:hypothetical protein
MTQVRIMKDWDWPDLLRQTPNHSGCWEGVHFTVAPVQPCDYAIVLNGTSEMTTVTCPPEQIWSIPSDPPTEFRKPWHRNPSYSFRLFTSDPDLTGPPYIHSHPALPWHVNQDYDFLRTCPVPEKTQQLSWITSNLQLLAGHRARMAFLQQIRGKLPFDLWGRGFTPLADKWDGLAPYRYAIAVENYSNPWYWSEKLADCYLAWCMPIYYGCTRITDYFPAESLIQIDIRQPEAAIATIQAAMANHAWERNLDAIAQARELILQRYQIFPFLVAQIRHFESTRGALGKPQTTTIAPRTVKEPLTTIVTRKAQRTMARLLRLTGVSR